MCNLRDKTIKAMSYETRLRRYVQEKAEVIENSAGKSATEIEDALYELRKKWRI